MRVEVRDVKAKRGGKKWRAVSAHVGKGVECESEGAGEVIVRMKRVKVKVAVRMTRVRARVGDNVIILQS